MQIVMLLLASVPGAGFASFVRAAETVPSPAASPISPAPARLSLRQSVDYAVAHSPSVSAAHLTLEQRDLEYSNALAKLLPSLDLSATHGLQPVIPIATGTSDTPLNAPNSTTPWYSSLSLSLSETLYDNGASLTALDSARLNRELAQAGYEKARDSLILEVSTEFYAFSRASILLDVRRQQRQVLDRQLRMLSGQYHEGLKTESDYLRMQSQVQQAEIEEISAENEVRSQTLSLRKSLGDGPVTRRDRPGSLEFEPLAVRLDAPAPRLPEQLPQTDPYELRLARLQDSINGNAVTLAQREWWPRITLRAGASYTNQNYINIPPDTGANFATNQQFNWNALLVIDYNFWDWGIRRRNVRIAELTQDSQRAGYDTTILESQNRVETTALDIKRLTRTFGMSRTLLGIEEKSSRSLEAQYRDGKASYLDLITGLGNLLNARVQYYTAYFEVLSTLAKIDYYGGKISEADLERR